MARKVLVGILLLGALIIFALATFYIENWQFVVMAKGYRLRAHFERALSLSPGDEVRIAGVEVGRVHSISVDTETDSPRPVEVEMWIVQDVKVRSQDVASVEVRSIFGGSYVSIRRGDPSAPVLHDGDEISNTRTAVSITDVVARADTVLGQAQEALERASEGLGNLREITERVKQGEGTLGKLLSEDDTYGELRETLSAAREAFDGIKRFTAELHEGKGLAARLLNDEQLAADASRLFKEAAEAADELKRVASKVEHGEGLLAKLVNDEQMAGNVEQFMRDAAEAGEGLKSIAAALTEGNGAAARLLNDEQMGRDLQQAVADLKAFSATLGKLSESFDRSSLGRLASDDELYRKLSDTLEQLNQTVAAISEGEGTIGKLIRDEKLYKQLSSAMDTIQGLLDDYREQSPVLTFAGAVFGAF